MTRMKCVLAVVATAFLGTTAVHAADVVLSFDAVGTSDPEHVFTYDTSTDTLTADTAVDLGLNILGAENRLLDADFDLTANQVSSTGSEIRFDGSFTFTHGGLTVVTANFTNALAFKVGTTSDEYPIYGLFAYTYVPDGSSLSYTAGPGFEGYAEAAGWATGVDLVSGLEEVATLVGQQDMAFTLTGLVLRDEVVEYNSSFSGNSGLGIEIVPEPATAALLAIGGFLIMGRKGRNRRQR